MSGGAWAQGWRQRGSRGSPRPSPDLLCLRGSIKQLHERVTQECAEYRALYEKMVLPPNVGPRVDWARVLEQKQVRGHPRCWRHLKELEVTPSSNQSSAGCHQGPHRMLGPGDG